MNVRVENRILNIVWNLYILILFIDIYKNNQSFRFRVVKFIFPIMFLLICFTDEYLVRHNPTLFFCFFTSLFCLQRNLFSASVRWCSNMKLWVVWIVSFEMIIRFVEIAFKDSPVIFSKLIRENLTQVIWVGWRLDE